MLLELKDIRKYFPIERGVFKESRGLVKALDGVSFSLPEFESMGIVGESGCGKTTLAKIILKLITPTGGEVIFDGEKIHNFRKDVQIIFQNPYNSLNPKMRIMDTISEPLLIHHIVPSRQVAMRVGELLDMVGLGQESSRKYPRELSGGERQRVCIARALATQPKILVLDEPISSLDLTMQVKLLDLFIRLKKGLRLTYIFISHNLAVIKHITDTVIVMQDGQIVERGFLETVFNSPLHPYTKKLLAAARG